ncbi:MAG: glycerol-3-phosphate 1-O-acyltransferase PlsY [Victivallaceae bacterium]|jgi:glycerol-3-phosphate acyltransferase PlsY
MTTGTVFLYIAIFLSSYLIGSVPWAYLIGRIYGRDLRKEGSGNIGATNVTRVIGKFWGRVCFLLDMIKGFLPVFIVTMLIKQQIITDVNDLAQIIAAGGAVIGHMFCVFLRFKGGKGVSTSAGCLLAMAPYSFAISGIVWVIVFLIGRYVSLASIAAAAVLPVSATFFSIMKVNDKAIYPVSVYILVFLYVLAVLAILKHTGNIKRLINGTEHRFDKKKQTAAKENSK